MGLTTTRWNSAEHLKTDEDIQLYLEACLDEADGDVQALVHALNVIARAKNLGQFESELVNDEQCKLLSPDSSPTFAMVVNFIHSLGFKLTVEPMV